MSERQKMLVFVGSYAEAADSGIYVYELDKKDGRLTLLHEKAGVQNPSFLNLDAAQNRLYAIGERLEDGRRQGAAVAYAIDPESGALRELNRGPTVSATTCHIQRDASGRFFVVTSYSGGQIGLVEVGEGGTIGRLLDTHQHEGASVNRERQEKPHPHSAFFSPDNRFVWISDLGLDRIRAYRMNTEDKVLEFHVDTEVPAGAGPRHFAFHPNGAYGYVINELDSTIVAFRYDGEAGKLERLQVVSTLPEGFAGESATAEIQVSPNGRFLYGSNRGHDSIAVFRIAEDGQLSPVAHTSTKGGHPRHFSLSPEGDYLLVANRDSNNIVVFKVDRENGTLHDTGYEVQASKPVCIRMAEFPVG